MKRTALFLLTTAIAAATNTPALAAPSFRELRDANLEKVDFNRLQEETLDKDAVNFEQLRDANLEKVDFQKLRDERLNKAYKYSAE
jgi:uncharacterized protein YjbI with pentapeptide repeats